MQDKIKPGPGKAPAEGAEIAYLIEGEGPIIASTHPYGMPRAGYTSLPGYTMVTVWPRGFGASSPARDPNDYGFWRLAEDLEAVRRHLGLDQWIFLGVSMGGMTGLVYALNHPEGLSAFICDSGAPSHDYMNDPGSVWPEAHATREYEEFLKAPSMETYRRFRIRLFGLLGEKDPEAAWETGEARSESNPFAYAQIRYTMPSFDVRPQLSQIKIPTLIVSGENDRWCTPTQARIIAQIPGSVLRIYSNTGHGVIRSNPDAMGIVNEFLRSIMS
ncbi:MAG: alpha/beta hydrolase [Candidatus Tectomicrobia bacterium]|nr:alpha/beta hydrolase [Candidatus Tectomicrobia bacterium]